MGAIVYNLNIHEGQNGVQPLMDYVTNKEKTNLLHNDAGLASLFGYAENEQKTTLAVPQDDEKIVLVSGVLCEPNTANLDFAVLKNTYREQKPERIAAFDYNDRRSASVRSVSKSPVIAVHLIQSFAETDLDPRIAHEIGVAFAERLGVQAVVSTHCNQDLFSEYGAAHVHNHIVVNAYMPNGIDKFYVDKKKRIELREMSDDLCREYGIEVTLNEPSIQQQLSMNTHNYTEWKSMRDGNSWKEVVREDIRTCYDVCDSKEEFIEMMTEFGYKITKTKTDDLCWSHPSKTKDKQVWGKRLGMEYTLSALFDESGRKVTYSIEQKADHKEYKNDKLISISRYDMNGRRRSDLEMLFRQAIRVLQLVRSLINRVTKKNKQHYDPNAKLQIMQEAINTMQEFGIETLPELNESIDLAGKNLNLAKGATSRLEGEMKYYAVVEQLIADYKDAKYVYDQIYKWERPHDLHLDKFSDTDIAFTKAATAPLSTRERNELFKLMDKHKELRIENAGKGYVNVSSIQFRAIRDYFKGKGPRPDCLVSAETVNHAHAYERQYKYLSEHLSYEPKAADKVRVKKLLAEHGHDIDVSKLTPADIINITNCYGPNPLSGAVIDEDKQRLLEQTLAKTDKTLARPVTAILEDEYDQIMNFISGKTKGVPSILKEDRDPSETDLEKTKKLAMQMGIFPPFDWDDFTDRDTKNLYNWLIAQGQDPFCVQETTQATWDQNRQIFHEEIECETLKKREILIALRNSINALSRLGISVDDIDALEKTIAETKVELENATTIKVEFEEEYKKLLRLKQQASYAKDKHFLYGSLFDSKEMKEIEKQAKVQEEERDNEPNEPSNPTPEKERENRRDTYKKKKKHRILDSNLDL